MEYFKNNVPQHQIAKALQISSSTVHNIIKRFREHGEISVRMGQGCEDLCWMPMVFGLADDTASLIDSVIHITKWAQEYFQKPLSVNTICSAICRCQIKLYHAKRKPYVNMVWALRRHCITHRHDPVIHITKWAQEYFQKPLSVNNLQLYLQLYHAKRKPYVNMVQKRRCVLWAKGHLKWTVSK